MYNYADDNTLCVSHENLDVMINQLHDAAKCAIHWFQINQMQANPNKFQGIIFSRNAMNEDEKVLLVGEKTIKCEPYVKLLGVLIDEKLTFLVAKLIFYQNCPKY